MKKKNGVSCTILLGVVIADFHMYQCPKHEIDSSLTLLNIEILALAEDTGTGEWIRTDGDCTYEVQGAVGSEVSILGMKIKVGADGYTQIINQISIDYQNYKSVCVIRVICVLIFILTHLQ